MPIRSPLGALGGLMILLQGIAAAALVPLQSQPDLQLILVWMMVGVTVAITSVVVIVVLWFALKTRGYFLTLETLTHKSMSTYIDLVSRLQLTGRPYLPESSPLRLATKKLRASKRSESR